MNVIVKGIPRGCQSLFTPVSLGYPLSVFNKNSTLKLYILSNKVRIHAKLLKIKTMPAHQHCDLFHQLAGDLIGSAIN